MAVCGDVDFDSVAPLASHIAVQEGVGPYDHLHADGADLRSSCSCLKKESVNKMKFVFDLDGILSF